MRHGTIMSNMSVTWLLGITILRDSSRFCHKDTSTVAWPAASKPFALQGSRPITNRKGEEKVAAGLHPKTCTISVLGVFYAPTFCGGT